MSCRVKTKQVDDIQYNENNDLGLAPLSNLRGYFGIFNLLLR